MSDAGPVARSLIAYLAQHPEGCASRDLRHLIPDGYMPSAQRGTAVSIRLGSLMKSGYVTRTSERVVTRPGCHDSDGGGGYLWYITPRGHRWLDAGFPVKLDYKQDTDVRLRRARQRRRLLRQSRMFMIARLSGYGRSTPNSERPAATALLHDGGLTYEQIATIFGVSREYARQYELRHDR